MTAFSISSRDFSVFLTILIGHMNSLYNLRFYHTFPYIRSFSICQLHENNHSPVDMRNLFVNLEGKKFNTFDPFSSYQVQMQQSRGIHKSFVINSKIQKGKELYFISKEFLPNMIPSRLHHFTMNLVHQTVLHWKSAIQIRKCNFNILLPNTADELKMSETYINLTYLKFTVKDPKRHLLKPHNNPFKRYLR